MSNDGLVTVDNAGTVRLWETGTASLEKSIQEWRKMIGAEVFLHYTVGARNPNAFRFWMVKNCSNAEWFSF